MGSLGEASPLAAAHISYTTHILQKCQGVGQKIFLVFDKMAESLLVIGVSACHVVLQENISREKFGSRGPVAGGEGEIPPTSAGFSYVAENV